MTVKEYIELLQKLPQDLEVKALDPGCGCCSTGLYEDVDEPEVQNDEKFVWNDPYDGGGTNIVKAQVVRIA